MVRVALEHAFPADWIDDVFEQTRCRQYCRELWFSTLITLMSWVTLGMAPVLADAQSGELWIADRNFCTRTLMQGWDSAGAGFVVRHPRIIEVGPWVACGRIETGEVYTNHCH
jgi:IS4 transposase